MDGFGSDHQSIVQTQKEKGLAAMNVYSFLNYTHGHTLQTLLKSIGDSVRSDSYDDLALENARVFAAQERRNLRRAITSEWQHTISELSYHLFHRSGRAAQISGCEAVGKGSGADQRFALPGTLPVGDSESTG